MRRSSSTQRGSPSSRPSLQASTFSPIAPSPSQSKPPQIDTTPKPNVEEKKARRSSIDWRGGFASLFGSTPSSPVVATTPTSQLPSRLRPLSLSSSPLLISPPRERPVAVSRVSDRRLSTAEEAEEEEDQLQKKRIELLQRQLPEEGVKSGLSSSPAKAERMRSSGSSFSYRPSMLPSVGTPPQRPNPIDSIVNHFGPSDSSSYFPTLTSPPGLVAGAQVTVNSSLPLRDVSGLTLDSVLCRRTWSHPDFEHWTRTSVGKRPRSDPARQEATTRNPLVELPSAVEGRPSAVGGRAGRWAPRTVSQVRTSDDG